jgi:hypothetical protein
LIHKEGEKEGTTQIGTPSGKAFRSALENPLGVFSRSFRLGRSMQPATRH